MKRPAGLIVSAVVLALASLLQVVMALFMVAASAIKPRQGTLPPPPAWTPYVLYGLAVFFLGLAVWGIVTAIGLHRLRNWARISVLIIGGCMAALGFFSMLAMLMMMFIPLPMPPSVDASHAHAVQVGVRVGFAVIALFYAAMLAVGVWWLIYFNRQSSRALFTGERVKIEESRRPLLIAIMAAFLLFGAFACLLMSFVPFPGLVVGLILRGWEKVLFFVAYAAVSAAAGIGLWRMKEWGRRLTLALMAFGVVNCSIYLLRPSLMQRVTAEVNKSMNLAQPALPEHFQNMFVTFEMLPSILLFVAIAAMLHHSRGRFSEPSKSAPLAPPAPESGPSI